LDVFCKFCAKHAYLYSLEVDYAKVKQQVDINKATVQDLDVKTVTIEDLSVSSLSVTGLSDLQGDVNVGGTLTVPGTSSLTTLTAADAEVTDTLTVTGQSALQGAVTVSGPATTSDALNVNSFIITPCPKDLNNVAYSLALTGASAPSVKSSGLTPNWIDVVWTSPNDKINGPLNLIWGVLLNPSSASGVHIPAGFKAANTSPLVVFKNYGGIEGTNADIGANYPQVFSIDVSDAASGGIQFSINSMMQFNNNWNNARSGGYPGVNQDIGFRLFFNWCGSAPSPPPSPSNPCP